MTERRDSGARKNSTEKISVAENVARLRECEDYNMALALQEQEYSTHFNQNRNQRRTMGIDHKRSKEEQLAEQKLAAEQRMAEAAEIARKDREIAKQIQQQLEEEDRRNKMTQAQLDEELARRLQFEDHSADVFNLSPSTSSTPAASHSAGDGREDKQFAKQLQEEYFQRYNKKKSKRHLDENTQNEFNSLVDTNFTQTLSSSNLTTFPPLPTYYDCISANSHGKLNENYLHSGNTDVLPMYESFSRTPIANQPSTSKLLAKSTTNFPVNDNGSLLVMKPSLPYLNSITQHPLLKEAKQKNLTSDKNLINFGEESTPEMADNDGNLARTQESKGRDKSEHGV